jgi:hypothetical protein
MLSKQMRESELFPLLFPACFLLRNSQISDYGYLECCFWRTLADIVRLDRQVKRIVLLLFCHPA